MLKYCLVFLITFLISTAPTFASGFVLQNIGSLDTGGNQYGEWWYQSQNPTLSGITAPSATVEVSVNGTVQTVTADASGHWTATTTMPAGDHSVSLNSSGSVISFTLHINQTMPTGISAPAAATQPVAGITTPTLFLILGGISLVALGIFSRKHAHLHH
jgi:hypothetical protein